MKNTKWQDGTLVVTIPWTKVGAWTVLGQQPPRVRIDAPAAGATVGGTVNVTGYALDSESVPESGISKVEVFVDGVKRGEAAYGLNHATACTSYPGRPGCPNVGYSFAWDTTTVANGTRTIRVVATDTDGTPKSGYFERTVTVSNTVGVSVSPAAAALNAGQTVQLTATVTGTSNGAVTWTRSPAVGSVSAGGLYTAPASIVSAQTATVTATSVADPTKSASATITLQAVGLAMSPQTVSLGAGQSQPFTVTVTGTANHGLNWSLSPSIGTLASATTATGANTYTAPGTVQSSQTVTLTATSVVDPSATVTATIALTPGGNCYGYAIGTCNPRHFRMIPSLNVIEL
jgi:hypothetical protein